MVGKSWMQTVAHAPQFRKLQAKCLVAAIVAVACGSLQANTLPQGQTAEPEPVRVEVLAVPEADLSTVVSTIVSPIVSPTSPTSPNQANSANKPPAAKTAESPANTEQSPRRVALLLPLRSETLGAVSEVIRSGFMAGFESEQDDIVVDVIESGESAADILDSYQLALAQHDVLVGPLPRAGVSSLIDSGVVKKPTIALNHPEPRAAGDLPLSKMPNNLLIMGLSIEEEGRQLANWAHANSGSGKANRALVISSNVAWQRRAAKAFAQQWQKLGQEAVVQEIYSSSGFLSAAGLANLKNRLQVKAPEKIDAAVDKAADKPLEKIAEKPPEKTPILAFVALDAEQTRQLRHAIGNDLPIYGTSQLNRSILTEGDESEPLHYLDGVRLLDIPWQLQRDHPAVMIYPRLIQEGEQKRSADLERLYALGIDAYRVARAIAQKTGKGFELDGVTGKLVVSIKKDQFSFERTSQGAQYRQGRPQAIGQFAQ